MKSRSLFFTSLVMLIFSVSCSHMELPMTQEFKDNHISSKFDYPGINMELEKFLDYRIFKTDSIRSYNQDSIIRPGFVLPGHSIREDITESTVYFGKPSDTCTINYVHSLRYDHEGRSATVSVINLFSKRSNRIPQETSDKILGDETTGTVQYATANAHFAFTNIKLNEMLSGYLVINNDSFLLRPAMGGKINKNYPMGQFMGMQLVKNNIMYAGMMRTFGSDDWMYMYTKASVTEQMLIAAYFAIIERNW